MTEFKHLRQFKKNDSAAVSELFQLVYGSNYVYLEVYNPETFHRNHENGLWESILAIGPNDEILGHGLLWKHLYCPEIPEMSLIAVHPKARNLGLAFKICQKLIIMAKRNGSSGISSKQVCNHPFSQRLASSLGFFNLSFLPAYVSSPFISGDTRESIVGGYIPLNVKSTKTLFIPEKLRPSASLLVHGLDEIEFLQSPIRHTISSCSEVEILQLEPKISELYIRHWGADGPSKLDVANPNKLTCILVDAELSENTLACEHLLSLGFIFMGLVPDRFNSWTWLFCKNFALEATYVLMKKLMAPTQEGISTQVVNPSFIEA